MSQGFAMHATYTNPWPGTKDLSGPSHLDVHLVVLVRPNAGG